MEQLQVGRKEIESKDEVIKAKDQEI